MLEIYFSFRRVLLQKVEGLEGHVPKKESKKKRMVLPEKKGDTAAVRGKKCKYSAVLSFFEMLYNGCLASDAPPLIRCTQMKQARLAQTLTIKFQQGKILTLQSKLLPHFTCLTFIMGVIYTGGSIRSVSDGIIYRIIDSEQICMWQR